jgi:hypothetical protein
MKNSYIEPAIFCKQLTGVNYFFFKESTFLAIVSTLAAIVSTLAAIVSTLAAVVSTVVVAVESVLGASVVAESLQAAKAAAIANTKSTFFIF